jgi:tRNA-specific 2-thiouridylase
MSGGVDSSVAALFIREMGHDVVGVTMRIYGDKGVKGLHVTGGGCYGPGEEIEVEDARRVCSMLDIPHREVDLRSEYRTHVLEYFKREYLSGRTPNPCIRCNQLVKFGLLFEKLAVESGLGFDLFATGHYARVSFDPPRERFLLRKAADAAKDQSYFLCMLSQAQLARTLFPLGGLSKPDVRRIARERGLGVHDKEESQDFSSSDYRSILHEEGETAPPGGPIKNSRGEVLGTHEGIWSYTVGQRRGLGISGGKPLYVTDMDRDTNTVFVGQAGELYRRGLVASSVNWVGIKAPVGPIRAAVRIRYRHDEAAALVTPMEDGSARVLFDDPQRSIARGQWAVFYDGDLLLGGGAIEGSW